MVRCGHAIRPAAALDRRFRPAARRATTQDRPELTESLPTLDQALAEAARLVNGELDRLLPRPAGFHARVQDAMRYAITVGGKRMRPFLVLQGSRLFGAPDARALRAAAAIEMVHTYSLIHDDLPCMDDDDLRRGQPTTHKTFDEATAVLAGDALLTQAFEVLAQEATHPRARACAAPWWPGWRRRQAARAWSAAR